MFDWFKKKTKKKILLSFLLWRKCSFVCIQLCHQIPHIVNYVRCVHFLKVFGNFILLYVKSSCTIYMLIYRLFITRSALGREQSLAQVDGFYNLFSLMMLTCILRDRKISEIVTAHVEENATVKLDRWKKMHLLNLLHVLR